jgi:hypothetical protein
LISALNPRTILQNNCFSGIIRFQHFPARSHRGQAFKVGDVYMNTHQFETFNRADRVRKQTPGMSKKFDRKLADRIQRYAEGPPHRIHARIMDLEQEWDIERTLVMQGSFTALLGLFLGLTVSWKWFYLIAINQFFLFQHSLFGWCPPMVLQRRLGMRTKSEIHLERTALKALRGHFGEMPSDWDAEKKAREALAAAAER